MNSTIEALKGQIETLERQLGPEGMYQRGRDDAYRDFQAAVDRQFAAQNRLEDTKAVLARWEGSEAAEEAPSPFQPYSTWKVVEEDEPKWKVGDAVYIYRASPVKIGLYTEDRYGNPIDIADCEDEPQEGPNLCRCGVAHDWLQDNPKEEA